MRVLVSCLGGAAVAAALFSCAPFDVPPIELDVSSYDRCQSADNMDVNTTASEIQCWIEDYSWRVNPPGAGGIQVRDEGHDLVGTPVCCEVCGLADRADAGCESLCKADLCSAAKDDHVQLASGLGLACDVNDDSPCGFSTESCMEYSGHAQSIMDGEDLLAAYYLHVQCDAFALAPALPNGLFAYVAELDGLPNRAEEYPNVHDVVDWCYIPPPADTDSPVSGFVTYGGGPAMPQSDGSADATSGSAADSGSADTTAGEGGEPPVPPAPVEIPPLCDGLSRDGAVRRGNNTIAWTPGSAARAWDGSASYGVTVSGGGLDYTVISCGGPGGGRCVRLDRLAIEASQPDAGLHARVGLVAESDVVPLNAAGRFEIPPGNLDILVHYSVRGEDVALRVSNAAPVLGWIDADRRTFLLAGLHAALPSGAGIYADMRGTLLNTQPTLSVRFARDTSSGRARLTAQARDAENDDVELRWFLPGVGGWIGRDVVVPMPSKRTPVLLFATDAAGARSATAGWLDPRAI